VGLLLFQIRAVSRVQEISRFKVIVRVEVIPYTLGLLSQVEAMPNYRWGCFPYQSRVVVRVEEFVRVKAIVTVEVIPYTLGFPMPELKLHWTFPCSESVISSVS